MTIISNSSGICMRCKKKGTKSTTKACCEDYMVEKAKKKGWDESRRAFV